MSRFILALDQGTTSSRAIVFDRAGLPVASHSREFRQIYPQSGWVEHDPDEIWSSQLDCAQQALRKAGVAATDIAAIGITNQRETVVVWDRRTGRPIANAIVWQDRRSAPMCARLRDHGDEPDVTRRTGLVLDPYFSATKLAWLLDAVPGARAAAERGELAFGTVDSWLIWHLSGGAHVTDPTNASRTLLLNLDSLAWDPTLLQLFGIPASVLPTVVASSGVAAHTRAEIFGASIPIGGIGGDQQAATFGQACLSPGMAKNTYGTGCFMLMQVGTRPRASRNRLLSTAGCAPAHGPRSYLLEGSVFVGGAVVQWLRDGLGLIDKAEDVEALARQVPDAGGVYLVPAFVGLGAPHWDPQARGTMIGLSRGTTKAHVARAALEAIALQSADLLAAMQSDAGAPLAELRVDGGASRNDFLMQLQADVADVPVVRPVVTETTALGAAYLAGLATQFWSGVDEIKQLWRVQARFEPQMSGERRAALLEGWSRAVERAKDWQR